MYPFTLFRGVVWKTFLAMQFLVTPWRFEVSLGLEAKDCIRASQHANTLWQIRFARAMSLLGGCYFFLRESEQKFPCEMSMWISITQTRRRCGYHINHAERSSFTGMRCALFELLCHVSLRGSCKKILKMSSLGGGCLKAFVGVSAVRF